MRSPTWETQPDLALAAVDRMRLSPEAAAPVEQNSRMATDREQLVEQLTEALDGDPETQGTVPRGVPRGPSLPAGPRAHEDEQHPHAPRVPHDAAGARSAHGRAGSVRRDRGLRHAAQGRVRRLPRRPERVHEHDPRAPQAVRGAAGARAAVRVRRRARLPGGLDASRRRATSRSSLPASRSPGSPVARASQRAELASSSTRTIPPRSSPAMSSSRRSPIRRGHRCSCRRARSSSMSARCRVTRSS